MMDGTDGLANVHALQTFGTDPALQAAGGFRNDLGFIETQGHLGEIRPARRRLPFRHGGPGQRREIRGDITEVSVFRPPGKVLQKILPAQIAMHFPRDLPARGHGPHHRGRTGGGVAGGINTRRAGAAVGVHGDKVARGRGETAVDRHI